MFAQRTLARPVELVGVGLHSGQPVRLGLYPSEPDSGLVFVRTDLEPPVTIPAQAHRPARCSRAPALRNTALRSHVHLHRAQRHRHGRALDINRHVFFTVYLDRIVRLCGA